LPMPCALFAASSGGAHSSAGMVKWMCARAGETIVASITPETKVVANTFLTLLNGFLLSPAFPSGLTLSTTRSMPPFSARRNLPGYLPRTLYTGNPVSENTSTRQLGA
jgi:hypothetical protein